MKKFFKKIDQFLKGIDERRLIIYATAGCYHLFMTLVPITLILCCILPYTPFNQEMILVYIDRYFTSALAQIVRNIVNTIYATSAAAITISILVTILSVIGAMKTLIRGMNAAYNCDSRNNFARLTLHAFIMMVVLILTLILSLAVMVYGRKLLEFLNIHIGSIRFFNSALSGARYLIVMGLLFVVFMILYVVMPKKKVKVFAQIPGAILASVLWVSFSWIYSMFVTLSDNYGIYGIIGTIIVAMIWLRLCLFFMLIGGYFNSFISEQRDERKTAKAADESAGM